MIITKEVEIIINKKNIEHYKEKGYDVKLRDVVKIKTEDLIRGCNKIIEVKCGFCSKQVKIPYCRYFFAISKFNLYTCNAKKCINTKR